VSEAHLNRYLAEFDFRYSYRVKTGYDDQARMTKLLSKGIGGIRRSLAGIMLGEGAQPIRIAAN